MFVVKRIGKSESVKFDKITARIEKLCYGLDRRFVNSTEVAKKVIEGLYDGVTTTELDNLAAETAASLTVKHPDYALLASRIAVSNGAATDLDEFLGLLDGVQSEHPLVVVDLGPVVGTHTGPGTVGLCFVTTD